MLSERETKGTLLDLTRLELRRFDSFAAELVAAKYFLVFVFPFQTLEFLCFSESFSFCGQTNRYV